MLPSRLLTDTVQLAAADHVLILNSAADPFVPAIARGPANALVLAEDNIAALQSARAALLSLAQEHGGAQAFKHVPFHKYISDWPAATMDVAVMNLLYQPGNAWVMYGLQVAYYALKPGGRLYVVGAKERGVLTVAKRMHDLFGNDETLTISKGHRVVCSVRENGAPTMNSASAIRRGEVLPHHPGRDTSGPYTTPDDDARFKGISLVQAVFAAGKLDEGTRLLLETLEVRVTDEALDIGCGSGMIGMHIARLASKGHVTMVDASLVAVDVARQKVEQSGLTNVNVLPLYVGAKGVEGWWSGPLRSPDAQAVLSQRFDLVVTNPPFHLGGLQTTEVAERFIREAAQVLHPHGRFYLVANRFLKYEPSMRACFKQVREVGGDTRYKVLLAHSPSESGRG